MNSELKSAIETEAAKHQWDPLDLATVISYETGGTFDPWKKGPTTQHGTHRGLIQWGEPQARDYGVFQGMPVAAQMAAVSKYLIDRGVKPGDGILPIYAAINAGNATRIHASDANNGGAPGTVLDKVRGQMDGHRRNASALLGGSFRPITISDEPNLGISGVEVPVTPLPPVQLPDAPQASLWQLTKDAAATEQTLPWMFNPTGGIYAEKRDPNFTLTSDRIKADFGARGLPMDEQYLGMIEGSRNEAQYKTFMDDAQANFERTQRLSQAGLVGTGLQIANQVLDPVALVADVAAASVAPELVLARRGGRLYSALAGAVGGAAGGFASEGIKEVFNPNHDRADLLFGTVMGFGVGGAVGALMRSPSTLPEAATLQKIAKASVKEYEESTSGLALTANASSAGAARTGRHEDFLKDDALNALDIDDFSKTAFGKARFSLSAYLNETKNTVGRLMAGLVQDGVGKVDGAVNHISASETKDRLVTEFDTSLNQVVRPQLRAYMKERGYNVLQEKRAFYELESETQRYMHDTRPIDARNADYSQAAVNIGSKLKAMYAEIQKLQKNPGMRDGLTMRPVYGANEIPDNADWTGPRYISNERVILASGAYKDGELVRLAEGAIGKAQAHLGLKPELLHRIAKSYVTAIVKRAHGLDAVAHGHVSAEDMVELVQTLENHGGLSRQDAKDLLHSFKKHGTDQGRDAPQRHRMLLDMNYRLEGLNGPRKLDGTVDEDGIGMMDLIEQGAITNFERYLRPAMGRIALARYQAKDPRTGELIINGIVNDTEFRHLLDATAQKNADLIRAGEMTEAEGKDLLKKLEFAYNAIMGRPLNDLENTQFGWMGRMIRKYNFARIMNQVGWAQVSEFGNVLGTLGPKAALSQMPALRRAMNHMTGETLLQNGLGRDLELFIPVGGDRMNARTDYRFDDLTGIHDAPQGSWKSKFEHFLDASGRVTSEVSGMTQVNIMLNRWTAKAIVQKFSDFAATGKGFSAKRLADLGLDKDMTDRVVRMFNEPGNFEHSTGWITKQKVTRAHFDKWSDKEAAEAFRAAAYRLATQVVQRNDIGNMMMWMSHPAAKMLMQFRTFMVGSYEKQTLKSALMRDRMALGAAVGSMGFAALAYVAQTKIAAVGRSDSDEFLEDRLSWDKIGAATFARAGVSSIIPMLIDTGAYMTGNDAMFAHTRTTGQVSNMILGNPTTGGLDDMVQAFRAISALPQDRDWSQEEARALTRILPFGNAAPVVMGMNGLIADLPEFAPRR